MKGDKRAMEQVSRSNQKDQTTSTIAPQDSTEARKTKLDAMIKMRYMRRFTDTSMLTRKDLNLNIVFFDFLLQKMRMSPFEFDPATNRMELLDDNPKVPGFWKSRCWRLWQVVDVLHVSFIIYQTLKAIRYIKSPAISDVSNLAPVQLPLMLICTVSFGLVSGIIQMICGSWPELFCKLYNEIFELQKNKENLKCGDENETNTEMTRKQKPKNRRIEKRQRRLHERAVVAPGGPKGFRENIICYFPLTLYLLAFSYVVLYTIDIENEVLLVNLFSKEQRSRVLIVCCAAIETGLIIYRLAYAHFSTYFPLAFMLTFKKKIAKGVQELLVPINYDETDVRYELKIREKLENASKTLRELVLSLKLFNLCFSHVAYMQKFVTLSCSILGGYSIIAFPSHLHSAIYFLFAVNATIGFIGIYSCGKLITKEMEVLKEVVILTMSQLGPDLNLKLRSKMNEYTRLLKSMPASKIQIGGFKMLEREADIIFFDAIIQNIVNLLIAFR